MRIEHLRETLLAELARLSKEKGILAEDRQQLYEAVNRGKILQGRINRKIRINTWIELACESLLARQQFLYIRSSNNQKSIRRLGLLEQTGGRKASIVGTLSKSQRERYDAIRKRILEEHDWLNAHQKQTEELLYPFLEYREIQRNHPLNDSSIREIFKQLAPKLDRLYRDSPKKLL